MKARNLVTSTPVKPVEFDEHLLEMAEYAEAIALKTCGALPIDGESCAWYHGFWPRLRALGIAPGAALQETFYTNHLRATFESNDAPRVLILGCGDHGLLAQVIRAAIGEPERSALEIELTIADACATPLAVCRAFLERLDLADVQIDLHTEVGHALERTTTEAWQNRFDVVLVHSLLGYFDHASRPALLEGIAESLAHKGKLLLVQKINNRPEHSLTGFNECQREGFIARVKEQGVHHGLDADRLKQAAANYADRFRIYGIPSVAYVRDLFADGGLDLISAEEYIYKPRSENEGSGPTQAANAEFIDVVAMKRDRG